MNLSRSMKTRRDARILIVLDSRDAEAVCLEEVSGAVDEG
jgi:hypothetical protein